jgi:HlyD family secretion protein
LLPGGFLQEDEERGNMKPVRKILPGLGIALVLAGILTASLWPERGEVPVQVARVERRDLVATVRATGMVFPRSYSNVLGQGYGRVTEIKVHEGEQVQPGDVLLETDPVQATSTVRAEQAALAGAQASLRAAEAGVRGGQAAVAQRQADLAKAKFDWDRGRALYQAKVISRQSFENYRSAYDGAVAALAAARAELAEARAEESRANGNFAKIQATLAHAEDVLSKTVYRAPIPGTVTNISVRVGEDVIPGVPDSTGAYLMTISNMSDPLVQVRVDENDILNLRNGQSVEVHLDAFPGQTFGGHVVAVGTQAVITETGVTTSQMTGGTTGQQATDYKVDIALEHPPAGLRPGMTVTSVIETANKKQVVAVPFQALVLRPKSEAGRTSMPKVPEAGPVEISATPESQQAVKESAGVTGVFVVRSGRAIFSPVDIGVLGENAVEVRQGVKAGEEIIVGGYSALHLLHSGMTVKIVRRDK